MRVRTLTWSSCDEVTHSIVGNGWIPSRTSAWFCATDPRKESVNQCVFLLCRLSWLLNQLLWAHHSPSLRNSRQGGTCGWWWESFCSCYREQTRHNHVFNLTMTTEESDLLSAYLSSFIAICKGSVSPSNSTMTGAHILWERPSVKVIYFIEKLKHRGSKYSILILTTMWHKKVFFHRSMGFIPICSSGMKQRREKRWHLLLKIVLVNHFKVNISNIYPSSWH